MSRQVIQQGTLARLPGARLPRSLRMEPVDYRATFDHARSFPGRLLVLWLHEVAGREGRLGVVASRKALHEAVSRNRARRLLRESFRLNRGHLKPNLDVLLLARGRIERAKRQEVDADLRAVCLKAGIWRDKPC